MIYSNSHNSLLREMGSRKRKFMNRMQVFLTSASLILTLYMFQQNVSQAISNTRTSVLILLFSSTEPVTRYFSLLCTLLLRQHKSRGIYFSKHPDHTRTPSPPINTLYKCTAKEHSLFNTKHFSFSMNA